MRARVRRLSGCALGAKTTSLSGALRARNEPAEAKPQTAKFFRQGQPNVNTRARHKTRGAGDVGCASGHSREATPAAPGSAPRRRPRAARPRWTSAPARAPAPSSRPPSQPPGPVLRRGVPGQRPQPRRLRRLPSSTTVEGARRDCRASKDTHSHGAARRHRQQRKGDLKDALLAQKSDLETALDRVANREAPFPTARRRRPLEAWNTSSST